MIKLTDETFNKEVIESEIPVLVDFHADWCGPCKMLAPTIEKIDEDYKGKVKVCGANVDTMPLTSLSFQIMSVPTLLFFKNGKIEGKLIGVSLYSEIENLING